MNFVECKLLNYNYLIYRITNRFKVLKILSTEFSKNVIRYNSIPIHLN